MKFCPECKIALNDKDITCCNCGAKVKDVEPIPDLPDPPKAREGISIVALVGVIMAVVTMLLAIICGTLTITMPSMNKIIVLLIIIGSLICLSVSAIVVIVGIVFTIIKRNKLWTIYAGLIPVVLGYVYTSFVLIYTIIVTSSMAV